MSLARPVFNLQAIEFWAFFAYFHLFRHLKGIQLFQNMPKPFIFDKLSNKKNRLKIALQVPKLGFRPIVMPEGPQVVNPEWTVHKSTFFDSLCFFKVAPAYCAALQTCMSKWQRSPVESLIPVYGDRDLMTQKLSPNQPVYIDVAQERSQVF